MVKKKTLATVYYPLTVIASLLINVPELVPLMTISTLAMIEKWKTARYIIFSSIIILLTLPKSAFKLLISAIIVGLLYPLTDVDTGDLINIFVAILTVYMLKINFILAIPLAILYYILKGDYIYFNLAAVSSLISSAYLLLTIPKLANEAAVVAYYSLLFGVLGMLYDRFRCRAKQKTVDKGTQRYPPYTSKGIGVERVLKR